MALGLIIIGDEILSGRRTDRHLPALIELLSSRGMRLDWTEIVGDDPQRITATLERTFATRDIVFCCGGIGATPDDHTRHCAAAALKRPLQLHPDAKAKIQERITETALAEGKEPQLDSPDNLHRLKMGEFPQGAAVIPNPYNKIPGFTVAHDPEGAHHFLPGFPVMAAPMMEWVLDNLYLQLFHREDWKENSLFVFDSMESTLTPLMERIENVFSPVKIFSLPHVGGTHVERHIELGVKGEAGRADAAFEKLKEELDSMGVHFESSLNPGQELSKRKD